VLVLRGHIGAVWGVAFSPSDRWIVSASGDNSVKVWDASPIEETISRPEDVNASWFLTLSPKGNWVAWTSPEGEIRIKVGRKPTGPPINLLAGSGQEVRKVAFSPDGQHIGLALADFDESVRTFHIYDSTGKVLASGKAGTEISHMVFSADGWQIAVADGTAVTLWDLQTQSQVFRFTHHEKRVTSLAFDPSGRWLASGSDNGAVMICSAQSGENGRKLQDHRKPVVSLAFSHDGKRLASAGQDNTVKTQNLEADDDVRTLEGLTQPVNDIAFSPNDDRVALASDDGTVKVWDPKANVAPFTLPGGQATASGKPSNLLESAASSLNRSESPFKAVAFSPAGKELTAATGDGSIRIWRAD
jgi:WD40 repeat protein